MTESDLKQDLGGYDPSAGAPPATSSMTGVWNTRRKQILEWLVQNAPSLVDVYRGAVAMAVDPSSPGRVNFVGHTAREIANRLPSVVADLPSEQVQYKNQVDDIVKLCARQGFSLEGALSAEDPALAEPVLPVPRVVLQRIARLIYEHERGRQRPEQKARRLFEALVPESANRPDQATPVINQWLSTTGWFMSNTHIGTDPPRAETEKQLLQRFEQFEASLHSLVSPFMTTIEELDDILDDANG